MSKILSVMLSIVVIILLGGLTAFFVVLNDIKKELKGEDDDI